MIRLAESTSLVTNRIDPLTKNLRGDPSIEFNPTETFNLAGKSIGAVAVTAALVVLYKGVKGLFSKSASENKDDKGRL